MTTIGIRELRDNLSRVIKRVEEGEVIRVLRHGKDVVELRPAEKDEELALLSRLKDRHLLGQGKGIVKNVKTVKNRKPDMPISDLVIEDRR